MTRQMWINSNYYTAIERHAGDGQHRDPEAVVGDTSQVRLVALA